MKSVKLKSGFLAVTCAFCLALTGVSLPAQTLNWLSATNANNVETKKCENLANFLSAEFSKNTKELEGVPSARLYGVQEKDATAKALNVCARLKAKKLDSKGDDLIYQLPDGLGTIVIHEVYNEGIFLKMSFVTDCNKLPFSEIWYVSLKRYNEG
jgi:hypothetical protein